MIHTLSDEDLIAGWRLDQERRALMPRTIYHRCSQVRGWARWSEPRGGVAAQSAEDVQQFLDGRHIGPKTRYGWLSTLHCFYEWAVNHGHLAHDPTVKIIRPRLRRSLPRPVSNGDLTVALEMAPPTMRAWLTLAAFNGLRCAEIGRLTRSDIIDDGAMLRVLGKGDKERVIPLHPETHTAMRLAGMPRQGHLYRRPQGGRWPPALVSRTINAYLADVGVDATAHQLRHWFGTRTYAACRDIRVVQELMGHSSPTVTAVYAAFSERTARQAVHALSLGPAAADEADGWTPEA